MGHEDGGTSYGLVTAGRALIGLPLASLREVVPFPDQIEELPVQGPGLIGAMSLRDAVVPLLDLGNRTGAGTMEPPTTVVLVEHRQRLIGIAGHGVQGIVHVAARDRQTLVREGDPLLFSHVFQHPATGAVVSVLDVGRAVSLPGVPVAGGVPTRATAAARSDVVRRVTVVRIGAHRVAFEVDRARTTLPPAPLHPSVLSGGPCLGVVHHGGDEVPVVDPLQLLGLGALDAIDGPRVVLSLPHGSVALQLSDVLRIHGIHEEEMLPVPAATLRHPELLHGIALIEGVGQVFVVDGAALGADPRVRPLGRLLTRVDATTGGLPAGRTGATPRPGDEASGVPEPTTEPWGGTDRAARQGAQAVLLHAGIRAAVPLQQVDEIIPWPSALIPSSTGGGVIGLVVHRDAALAVYSLNRLLGRPAAPPTDGSCVLVSRIGGVPTGFAVDRLVRIDRVRWAPPPDEPPARRLGPLVLLGDDPGPVPALDLGALVGGSPRVPAPA